MRDHVCIQNISKCAIAIVIGNGAYPGSRIVFFSGHQAEEKVDRGYFLRVQDCDRHGGFARFAYTPV